MKTIVVDVDLTVVDTLSPWILWWEKKTEQKFPWEKIGAECSVNDALKEHMSAEDILDYWKQKDLYDNLEPMADSVSTLKLLSNMYEIYFVSMCFDEHYESKVRFVNKYFPFHCGLINTPLKYKIEADIYFDDHVDFTQKIVDYRPHSKVYQLVTADNEYQLVKGATPLNNWSEFNELHFT